MYDHKYWTYERSVGYSYKGFWAVINGIPLMVGGWGLSLFLFYKAMEKIFQL
jgi:hypothetical protein